MNKIIQIVFMVISVAGCKRDDSSKPVVFERIVNVQTDATQGSYDSRIDSVKCIFLETTDRSLLKEVDKVIFQDSNIFILSRSAGVLNFSASGKFKQEFGASGRAPGEYLSCFDISVDGDHLYIYDNHQRKMLQYRLGDARYTGSFPVLVSSTEAEKHGDYIFAKSALDKTALCAHRLKNDTLHTLLQYGEGEFDLHVNNQLVSSGGKLFWLDPLRYSVYKLSDDQQLEPYLKFDFGTEGLTEDELKLVKAHAEIQAMGKVSFFSNFYETPDFVIATYLLNKSGYTMIYNKLTHKLYNIKDFSMKLKIYQHFSDCVGVWGNYFCMVRSTTFARSGYEDFIQSGEELPEKYSFYQKFSELEEDANPVLYLVKYK